MSPWRPESCAEAKFAVATARKRAMVVLVMVRFMLVMGLERKVLCLRLYWLCYVNVLGTICSFVSRNFK